jgi:NADH-quinone oxidoreductase subunit N
LGLVLLQQNAPAGHLFHQLLYLDAKALFFKVLILGATLLVLLHVQLTSSTLPSEFYSLLVAVALGLCLMTMATNGLSIYLSIELVSIGSYLLAAFGQGKKSSEGALKYLLFGAMSSGVMLYGLSFLYGLTGTLDVTSEVFARELAQNPPEVLWVVGFLTLAGVLFKFSLVPFHVYAPDMYEGAPTPVVAYLSTAPKVAALLVLMRLVSVLPVELPQILTVLVLTSILVGNLSALWQQDLKRLLAYSGIAQAGFILVGVVAFNQTGFEGSTFYVVAYILMNLGAFLGIHLLAGEQPTLDALAGKGSSEPLVSVCLTVLMVALVGLPPTVGFTAKLLVFSGLWESYQNTSNGWSLGLLVIGLLNTVVALFYYFKIPYYLFFKSTPQATALPISLAAKIALLVLALMVVALFLRADALLGMIAKL